MFSWLVSIPVPASLSPLDVSSRVLPPALPPACPVRQLCEPPRPKSQKKVVPKSLGLYQITSNESHPKTRKIVKLEGIEW